MAIVSRVFSVCPRIAKRGDALEAVTSLRLRVITLGTAWRAVQLMPHARVVRIEDRRFWLFSRIRALPFDSIRSVVYGYANLWAGIGWVQNTVDLFNVGLRLHDGGEVHLFGFLGDGPMENTGPLPDWCFFDQFLLDTIGTQETESQALAGMLARVIGVELVQS